MRSRLTFDRTSILNLRSSNASQKRQEGRLSLLFNEDDYDYAIELRPDDEYRQTAEALPRLVDFDEIELLDDIEAPSSADGTALDQTQGINILPFSNTRQSQQCKFSRCSEDGSGNEGGVKEIDEWGGASDYDEEYNAGLAPCATNAGFDSVEAETDRRGLNISVDRGNGKGNLRRSTCIAYEGSTVHHHQPQQYSKNVRRISNFDSSMSVLHSLRTSYPIEGASPGGSNENLQQFGNQRFPGKRGSTEVLGETLSSTAAVAAGGKGGLLRSHSTEGYDLADQLHSLEGGAGTGNDYEGEQLLSGVEDGLGLGLGSNDSGDIEMQLQHKLGSTGDSSASADSSGRPISSASSSASAFSVVTKREFSFRLNRLEKQRKWVDRAARRSSIGFYRHHPFSEKETMDKFLVALGGGVHIRRHQAGKVAETVRLFSVSGCRTIEWNKPKALDLQAQRKRQGVLKEGRTSAIFNTKYDQSAFDCCITICGCGDDLIAGNDSRQTGHDATNIGSSTDENNYSGFGRTFYNWGFKRRGAFKDRDIIAVQPAYQEDPTSPGNLGTETLRRSKDAYSAELTFSVVLREVASSQGYSTLDIECETADMYYLLLRGFRILQEEQEERRMLRRQQRAHSQRSQATSEASGGDTDSAAETGSGSARRLDEISSIWNAAQGYIAGAMPWERDPRGKDSNNSMFGRRGGADGGAKPYSNEAHDSINALYAPTWSIDPLRALRVGGGLLPAHQGLTGLTRRATSSPSASPMKVPLRSPPLQQVAAPPSASAGIGGGAGAGAGAGQQHQHQLPHQSSAGAANRRQSDLGMKPSLGPHGVGVAAGGGGISGVTRPVSYRSSCIGSGGGGGSGGDGSDAVNLPLAQFLGWTSAGTQIWARLKMAGLDVKCVLSWDLKRVILKIRCPSWRLEQMAEQMHLKVKSRDGYLKQFKVSRRDTFAAMGAQGSIFRSSERQQIIDYILRSKIKDGGAELDESTELGKQIVQRFPLHMYSKLVDIRHSWVTFWKRESPGVVAPSWSPFTESYRTTYNHIRDGAVYFFDNLLTQPLDSVAEYFGENVAFYFAYMAFYTRWLVFPSLLGFIVFCFQMAERRLDHWLCPIYAVVVMVWACFMLAFWRQKASALAYRWGVLDYEVDETERPQFRGAYTYDESTGEVRKTYSLWKRSAKYFLSIPVISLAILGTLVIMTAVFYSQDRLYDMYIEGQELDYSPAFPSFKREGGTSSSGSSSNSGSVHDGNTNSNGYSNYYDFYPINGATGFGGERNNTAIVDDDGSHNASSSDEQPWSRQISVAELANSEFWAVTFFYPCLYGMLVSLLTLLFECIAVWLNDFENHRTQTTYMNRLILKVFSFQFVSVFTSLYYYAFFMRDQEGAFMRISVTIFSLMTVGQWWSIFLDIAVPSFYHRALVYRMKANFASTNRKIYRAREYIESFLSMHRRSAGSRKQQHELDGGGNGDRATKSKSADGDQILAAAMHAKIDKRKMYLNQAKSLCWEEALQAKYNNFRDYTHMVIQIGFVLFFASIFPLAPLLALVNNIALIRFNAMKICFTRQRPVAQKIGGIGVWQDVLQIMSVGGIITNCAILFVTSTQLRSTLLPEVGSTGLALILFLYEHVILMFKYWLHGSIPTVPPSVQRARARERKSIDRKSLQRRNATVASALLQNKNGGSGGGGGSDGKKQGNRFPFFGGGGGGGVGGGGSGSDNVEGSDDDCGEGGGAGAVSSSAQKRQSNMLLNMFFDLSAGITNSFSNTLGGSPFPHSASPATHAAVAATATAGGSTHFNYAAAGAGAKYIDSKAAVQALLLDDEIDDADEGEEEELINETDAFTDTLHRYSLFDVKEDDEEEEEEGNDHNHEDSNVARGQRYHGTRSSPYQRSQPGLSPNNSPVNSPVNSPHRRSQPGLTTNKSPVISQANSPVSRDSRSQQHRRSTGAVTSATAAASAAASAASAAASVAAAVAAVIAEQNHQHQHSAILTDGEIEELGPPSDNDDDDFDDVDDYEEFKANKSDWVDDTRPRRAENVENDLGEEQRAMQLQVAQQRVQNAAARNALLLVQQQQLMQQHIQLHGADAVADAAQLNLHMQKPLQQLQQHVPHFQHQLSPLNSPMSRNQSQQQLQPQSEFESQPQPHGQSPPRPLSRRVSFFDDIPHISEENPFSDSEGSDDLPDNISELSDEQEWDRYESAGVGGRASRTNSQHAMLPRVQSEVVPANPIGLAAAAFGIDPESNAFLHVLSSGAENSPHDPWTMTFNTSAAEDDIPDYTNHAELGVCTANPPQVKFDRSPPRRAQHQIPHKAPPTPQPLLATSHRAQHPPSAQQTARQSTNSFYNWLWPKQQQQQQGNSSASSVESKPPSATSTNGRSMKRHNAGLNIAPLGTMKSSQQVNQKQKQPRHGASNIQHSQVAMQHPFTALTTAQPDPVPHTQQDACPQETHQKEHHLRKPQRGIAHGLNTSKSNSLAPSAPRLKRKTQRSNQSKHDDEPSMSAFQQLQVMMAQQQQSVQRFQRTAHHWPSSQSQKRKQQQKQELRQQRQQQKHEPASHIPHNHTAPSPFSFVDNLENSPTAANMHSRAHTPLVGTTQPHGAKPNMKHSNMATVTAGSTGAPNPYLNLLLHNSPKCQPVVPSDEHVSGECIAPNTSDTADTSPLSQLQHWQQQLSLQQLQKQHEQLLQQRKQILESWSPLSGVSKSAAASPKAGRNARPRLVVPSADGAAGVGSVGVHRKAVSKVGTTHDGAGQCSPVSKATKIHHQHHHHRRQQQQLNQSSSTKLRSVGDDNCGTTGANSNSAGHNPFAFAFASASAAAVGRPVRVQYD